MSSISFADIKLGSTRKSSRISVRLTKLNTIVNWDKIYDLVKEDEFNESVGGRPDKDILSKIKSLFCILTSNWVFSF